MNDFQLKLKSIMNEYVHFVYQQTRSFPKQEMYSSVSQWRRCSLSIVLNYVEGYARNRRASRLYFLEISYGSLMESTYLIDFFKDENILDEKSYINGSKMSKEIGSMLWTEMSKLKSNLA